MTTNDSLAPQARHGSRKDIEGVAALLAAILALASAGGADARSPEVFRQTRFAKEISALPLGPEVVLHGEPHVAVDPNDPSIVVTVFQQRRLASILRFPVAIAFATSHDGGATWVTDNLPGLSVPVGGPFDRATDPAAAIGPDGAVYAQMVLFNVSDCRSAMAVLRSDDGGLTWGSPVLLQDDSDCATFPSFPSPRNDKGWIAVDTFPGSPHYGRVYSAWSRGVDPPQVGLPIMLRHSDDRGATWGPLIKVSPADGFEIGALPLVQPNGDLTIVYCAYLSVPPRVLAQTSHDGGDTFDPPVSIATYEGVKVPGLIETGGVFVVPAAAVDPVTGSLYAAWHDARFRSDGQHDIVLSTSTDGGATWGPLHVVNPARAVRPFNHFTAAVAAHGGAVILTYRSRREDDPNKVYARRIASADNGVTFGRERNLGKPGDLRFAATTTTGEVFLGDYMGLAATADAVHAAWCRPSRPPRSAVSPHHQTTWGATMVR